VHKLDNEVISSHTTDILISSSDPRLTQKTSDVQVYDVTT